MNRELCLVICFLVGVAVFYLLQQSCGCNAVVEGLSTLQFESCANDCIVEGGVADGRPEACVPHDATGGPSTSMVKGCQTCTVDPDRTSYMGCLSDTDMDNIDKCNTQCDTSGDTSDTCVQQCLDNQSAVAAGKLQLQRLVTATAFAAANPNCCTSQPDNWGSHCGLAGWSISGCDRAVPGWDTNCDRTC